MRTSTFWVITRRVLIITPKIAVLESILVMPCCSVPCLRKLVTGLSTWRSGFHRGGLGFIGVSPYEKCGGQSVTWTCHSASILVFTWRFIQLIFHTHIESSILDNMYVKTDSRVAVLQENNVSKTAQSFETRDYETPQHSVTS